MGNFTTKAETKKKYEEKRVVDEFLEKTQPDISEDKTTNELQEAETKSFALLKAVDEKEKQQKLRAENTKVCGTKHLQLFQSSESKSVRNEVALDYKEAYLKTQEHIDIAEQEVAKTFAPLFQVKKSAKPKVSLNKSNKSHNKKKKCVEDAPTTQKRPEKEIPYCKKDPFTQKAEEVLYNFFTGNDTYRSSAPPKTRPFSYLRTSEPFWQMHQRAQRLKKHSCLHKTVIIPKKNDKNNITDAKLKKRNKWTQTDFPRDTWIHRKTTVGFGDTVLNVVSELSGEKLPCRMSPEDKVKASNQLSLLRLSILKLLGTHGFAEQVKENLKKKCPEFNVNVYEHKQKLVALCREKIDLIANPFVENIGPLPIEDGKYQSILREFINIFRNSLEKETADHPLREYTCTNADKPLDPNKFMTPELEIVKLQIIREYKVLKNGQEEEEENKPSPNQFTIQPVEKQQSTDKDPKNHTVPQEERKEIISSDDDWNSDTDEDENDENAVGDVHRPTLLEIRETQLNENKTINVGINPIGPFDRGTQYRTDGEIVVEKCKRGSRKNFLQKTKVKTRGVPNKHLRQNVVPPPVNDFNYLEVDNTKNYTETAENDRLNKEKPNEVENMNRSNNGEIKDDFYEDFERALYAQLNSVMLNDEKSPEYKEDTRHLTNLPSQVIVGKKNDCDLLEEKYRPKNNKKRQKDDKRKRQRTKLMQTTLQFGLNANNSADDPDMWSTDDEDDDTDFTSAVSYSDRPQPEDDDDTDFDFSPVVSYSERPLLEDGSGDEFQK